MHGTNRTNRTFGLYEDGCYSNYFINLIFSYISRMQQNAQRISRLWHDRPQSVMDSAIYWTEYVARHKSAPPSLPAKFNTWFEYLLIDVFIVIIGIVLLLGFLFYAIFKFIIYILRRIVSFFINKEKKE